MAVGEARKQHHPRGQPTHFMCKFLMRWDLAAVLGHTMEMLVERPERRMATRGWSSALSGAKESQSRLIGLHGVLRVIVSQTSFA
jgi:hypothetical protein